MKKLGVMIMLAIFAFVAKGNVDCAQKSGDGSVTASLSSNLTGAAVSAGNTVPTRRRRVMRPSGGVLERKGAIPTKPIAVVNKQKIVPVSMLEGILWAGRRMSHLPLRLGAENAPVKIELVESDDIPGLMAVYPEAYLARVNVRVLAADGAKDEVVAERLRKQIIRAALFALGAGYSPSPCLAWPVSSVKELDGLNVPLLSPETLTHLSAMSRLGIREVFFATYRQACREGWAPAPTNDVQKAIWEESQAEKERGPTNPITIPPPNAKK